MKISPALADLVADELMNMQMRGPFPYGHGCFGLLAKKLVKLIDEQRAKEAAEGREKAA